MHACKLLAIAVLRSAHLWCAPSTFLAFTAKNSICMQGDVVPADQYESITLHSDEIRTRQVSRRPPAQGARISDPQSRAAPIE